MRIDILTLFPEMFQSVLTTSILKRAADPSLYVNQREKLDLEPTGAPVAYYLTNIRDYTLNKHGKVDDTPYGGGPGMVIQCQPVWDAVQAVEAQDPRRPRRILMSPAGLKLTQTLVEQLSREKRLLIIAGHYEGIDQRVIDRLEPLEISIGDYVLSGGELPAMVLIDAVVRLVPGVLGDQASTHHESFSTANQGLLDYPHYTRPPVWQGLEVPQVLLSGDHAKIAAWRRQQSILRTRQRRPDLLPPELAVEENEKNL